MGMCILRIPVRRTPRQGLTDAVPKRLAGPAKVLLMYKDRWIECTPDQIRIRGYYFPRGTKRIP